MKKQWTITITLCCIVAIICTLLNRHRITLLTVSFNHELETIQAINTYHRIKYYSEIQACLKSGRYDDALKKIEISIDSDKWLLAKFLKENDLKSAEQYILKRSNDSIESIKSYSLKGPWTEPLCY